MSFGGYIECDGCLRRAEGYRPDDGWGPPGWYVLGQVGGGGSMVFDYAYCPQCGEKMGWDKLMQPAHSRTRG